MTTYKTAADARPNTQEQAVTDYLQEHKIIYAAEYRGEQSRDDWTCDGWTVTFTRPGRPALVTGYFTGLGHRVATRPMPSDISRLSPHALARVDWVRRNGTPHAPQPAAVLYSLLLDSSGAKQTFASWCNGFGYDTDSRKALATYEACQRIADKMDAFFTPEEREVLAALLEDYQGAAAMSGTK